MKLHPASVALFGLPAALAAVAATHPSDNATPTRPESALRVPGPSAVASGAPALGDLVEEIWESETWETEQREGESDKDNRHKFLRLQERVAPPPMSAHNSTLTSSSMNMTSAAAAGATAVAVFTGGDGAIYTVTSFSGIEAVDGKTLTAGGAPQLIGNENVSEATKGIVANGQTIEFSPYSSSSVPVRYTSSAAAPTGSSAAASASASASAAASSSSGGAAPRQTAGANMAAVVGAVVGAMIL